ncbi:MAG: hypothetical protein AMXMBFR7_49140 [Planctomycetota bacterium]
MNAEERLKTVLFPLMARWWQGQSVAAMAREAGVSRQRAHRLLANVSCTRAWRRKARAGGDSPRRAHPLYAAQALDLLCDPHAHRLTPRQRAALCWRAQGYVFTDIARRMGATGQGVRQLLVKARWRLEGMASEKPLAVGEFSLDVSGVEALFQEAIQDAIPRAAEAPRKHEDGCENLPAAYEDGPSEAGAPSVDAARAPHASHPERDPSDGPAWGEESEPPEDAAGVPDEDEEAEAVEVVQAQPERPRLKLSELQRAKRVVRPQETPAGAGVGATGEA